MKNGARGAEDARRIESNRYPAPLLTITEKGAHRFQQTVFRSWEQRLSYAIRGVTDLGPFSDFHLDHRCYKFCGDFRRHVSRATHFRVVSAQPAARLKQLVIFMLGIL